MNQKEIKDLIEFLIEKEIAEFELERGDVKLRIKRTSDAPPVTHYMQAPPMGPVAAPPAASHAVPHTTVSPITEAVSKPEGVPSADDQDLVTVKSPIVGTYYE